MSGWQWYVLVLGLVILTHGGIDAVAGIRSTRWPITAGQITGSMVEEDSDGVKSVRVEVAYSVAGIVHRRLEDAPLGGFPTDRHVGRAVARYRPGTPVSVRFDPARPSRSRLRPGVRVTPALEVVIGSGLVVLAFFGPTMS